MTAPQGHTLTAPLPEPAPAPADVHTIAHGYNLPDVDRLTHIAAQRAFGGHGTHADRYEAAREGVVTALLTATSRPTPEDLIHAGWRSLHEWRQDEARQHGRDHVTGAERSQYLRYWNSAARTTSSPEHHIVERTTLWQIWPHLTNADRQALLALACTGDYEATAHTQGLETKALANRLTRARRRFLELWHEHEQPSQAPWKRDRRISRRDGRGPHGQTRITVSQLDQIRGRHYRGETLTRIAGDYGVAAVTLSGLLTGRSRPAPDPTGAV